MKKAPETTAKKTRRCTCKQVFRQMCDSLGADIASPRCEALRAHVKDCPNCTAYLASLNTTVHLYESYPVPPLSARATTKLLKTLARHPSR